MIIENAFETGKEELFYAPKQAVDNVIIITEDSIYN